MSDTFFDSDTYLAWLDNDKQIQVLTSMLCITILRKNKDIHVLYIIYM